MNVLSSDMQKKNKLWGTEMGEGKKSKRKKSLSLFFYVAM